MAISRQTACLKEVQMTQGPSVFPILFACVLGRTSQAILQWRLEEGEYAGILDLLAASTSLTSTVTSQLKLQLFSVFGLGLVFVWALSPVGGQACVRLMDIGTKTTTHAASFEYMTQGPDFYTSGGRVSIFQAITDTLFASAVIAPPTVKSSPFDIWGHVKIPALEHYEKTSAPDSNGWFDTRSDRIEYSSLSGIPMSGINETTFIDYETTIETQYFSLRCGWHNFSSTAKPNNTAVEYEGGDADIWTDDDPEKRNLTDVDTLKPLKFSYWAFRGASHWSQCLLTTVYVEADIHCATVSRCIVSRARRSTKDNPPPASSFLDYWTTSHSYDVFSSYAQGLVSALSGDKLKGTQSVLQGYLFAPNNFVGPMSEGKMDADPSLSNETYSLRLQQLMNAYWACLTTPYALNGGLTPETADMDGISTSTYFKAHTSKSQGFRDSTHDIIRAHKGWCIVLCLSSLSMVVAALGRCVVHHFFCRGPDVALNLSCLAIRDNPFVNIPASGTFLDAADRAKLVKGLRLRLGDVQTDRLGFGYLAIGSLDAKDSSSIGGVRKDRMYA